MTEQIDYTAPVWGGGGDFLRLEAEGDKFYHRLIRGTQRRMEAIEDKRLEAKDVPVLVFDVDGEEREYTVLHADARKQLKEKQPQPGDWVGVKRGRTVGKTVLYDVIVKRPDTGGQAAVNPTAPAAASEPPAAGTGGMPDESFPFAP